MVFGVVAFIIFLPGIFSEFDVASKERAKVAAAAGLDAGSLPPPNKMVIATSLICFFFYFMNFVLVEA